MTPARVVALGRGWGGPTPSQILSFAPFPFCRFKDLLIHLQGGNFLKAFSAFSGCLRHYPCRHDRLAFLLCPAQWSPPGLRATAGSFLGCWSLQSQASPCCLSRGLQWLGCLSLLTRCADTHTTGPEQTNTALPQLGFLNECWANDHQGSYFHSHLLPMSAHFSVTPENN